MRKGQMVKCVSTRSDYLTAGKLYPITAGEGDSNLSLAAYDLVPVNDHDTFNITDDEGDELFCLYPECGHATWQLVDDHEPQ